LRLQVTESSSSLRSCSHVQLVCSQKWSYHSFAFFFFTKHHPDKPGGDVDTFRTLKRAQTVLSNPKSRQQYDILGLDLDDDEVEQDNSVAANDEGGAETQTTAQGIIQDIASAALTTVLQLGVRTGRCMHRVISMRSWRETLQKDDQQRVQIDE